MPELLVSIVHPDGNLAELIQVFREQTSQVADIKFQALRQFGRQISRTALAKNCFYCFPSKTKSPQPIDFSGESFMINSQGTEYR
jgi:hypothetical protein